MAFSDISAIIHNYFDEPESAKKPIPSKFCEAVKLFKKGAKPSDVVIKLDLTADEVEKFYTDYWRVERIHPLHRIYCENREAIPFVLRLYRLLEKKGFTSKMYEKVFDLVEKELFRKQNLARMTEEQALMSNSYREWLESTFKH